MRAWRALVRAIRARREVRARVAAAVAMADAYRDRLRRRRLEQLEEVLLDEAPLRATVPARQLADSVPTVPVPCWPPGWQ